MVPQVPPGRSVMQLQSLRTLHYAKSRQVRIRGGMYGGADLMLTPVPQDLCGEVVYGQSSLQVRHSYERKTGRRQKDGTKKKV